MPRLRLILLLVACSSLFTLSYGAAPPSKNTTPPCDDLKPPGAYTCQQQKVFGACNAPWMTKGNFCRRTCGVCKTPEDLAAESRAALNEAAQGVLSNDNLVVKPTPLGSTQLGATTAPPIAATTPSAAVKPAPSAEQPIISVPEALAPKSEAIPAAIATDCDISNQPSAYDIIMNSTDLTSLRAAVDVLNLSGVLQRKDVKFTLFEPTDSAFTRAASLLGVSESALLGSRNLLRDILLTHIIPNAVVDSQQLATVPSFAPQQGQPVYVVNEDGSTNLISVGSSAKVTEPDFADTCAYAIHKIDTVLLPNPTPRAGINPAYQAAIASTPVPPKSAG